ncbi:MAG: magnesium protoporphyrin IX methyltransferase [Boseongicola sp.]|nr:magnesium protoporphyrin IX methyltransferase [Boseongicola sp.]MDD9979117.1 magnesium protoporphyrin IX methyltransferase [Boseongicola sp.]
MTYEATRQSLETYFDRTASKTWERLTSDAPVSRIRQTVRAGRDQMRRTLLNILPHDLNGSRVLDAGCGPGQMAVELANRGADVVAVDISPSLIEVAKKRTPEDLASRISYHAGDMLNADFGSFDAVIAMDSLIHYEARDIASAIDGLMSRTRGPIAFTIAPKTPLLTAMWYAGKAFPRSDRSPAIRPHKVASVSKYLKSNALLKSVGRVASGFYISEAVEARG